MSEMKMENSRVPAEKIFNPDLKEAIVTMQEDNSKENVDKMITEVVKAKFILPAKVVPTTQAVTENGQTVMKQATQVQFRLLENQKKEKFFGLFTDTEELFKWKDTQNAQKVVTDFDSISQMVMDPHSGVVGFVINPFGKSVTFPKPMIISIKQQKDFNTLNKDLFKPGEQIKIGEPKDYPIDLMATLINHFSAEPNVNVAFLRMMEHSDKKSFLVVVDFIGDMKKIFDAIKETAQPYLTEDVDLVVMPVTMDLARNAINGVEPFYRKEQ